MKNAIVLAAGKSSRMKSKNIKVLHKILDKPLVCYVAETLLSLQINNIVFVLGNQKDEVMKVLPKEVDVAVQEKQLGTAHAVNCASLLADKTGETIILMGDCPLIKPKTIEQLIERNKNYDLTVLTTHLSEENTYGRIMRDKNGAVKEIIEYSDASAAERQISEVNTGVYCIKNEVLFKYLPYIIKKSEDEESKFTDIVKLLITNNKKVQAFANSDFQQFSGVNTRQELERVTNVLKDNINAKHLANGVTFVDKSNTYIGSDVVIEEDVVIYPDVHIYGKSVLKSGAKIFSGSFIENSQIGSDCEIKCSQIYDSSVGSNCKVGPNALIRKNSIIGNDCRIGAFVEVKSSTLYQNVKAAHLTYLGDSVVEENVNIGCGVVTVNYDGKNKFTTYIKKNSFIGSNVNLIAPIVIGNNCVVAAGSTITKDLQDNDMAIARMPEVVKQGYGKRYLEKSDNKNKS